MDAPTNAGDIAKGITEGGSPYLVYLFVLLSVSVVLYVLADYVKNHKTMIRVIDRNNRLMKRLCRKMARPGGRGIPGTPSSTGSIQRAAPRSIPLKVADGSE